MFNNDYFVGINYWDSKSAIKMWQNFDEEVIRSDFENLKKCGINLLRVFPLWPDFQPLTALHTPRGIYEYSHSGKSLPDTEAGRAGMSEEMCQKFQRFCDIANEYDIKLLVALLTGQMSFGLFVPPALERLNPITDAEAVRWEIRFIKYFVNRFKNNKAIVAWNPGNEVNCLPDDNTVDRDQFYVWCNTITNTIKSCDNTRPIISGMACSDIDKSKENIKDAGEVFDVCAAHIYNIFDTTNDSVNSIRPVLDSVFKVKICQDITGTPTFLEEFGAIGYHNCSKQAEVEYYRGCFFSTFSNGSHGLMYWCAFDQGEFDYAPYNWNTIGSNYGLFTRSGKIKPIGEEQIRINEILKKVPYLPAPKSDSVILVPRNDDDNVINKMRTTFILSQQAGLHPSFSYAIDEIPDSPLYIFPSLDSLKPITKVRFDSLLSKIEAGSDLYISVKSALLRDIDELTGIDFDERFFEPISDVISFNGKEYPLSYKWQYKLTNHKATVLATSKNGTPVYFKTPYGNGNIYFSTIPFESYLTDSHKEFNDYTSADFSDFYKVFAEKITKNSILSVDERYIITTENELSENELYGTVVNYGLKTTSFKLDLKEGYTISEIIGDYTLIDGLYTLKSNDGIILKLKK